jgi:hypothetical protein
MSQDLRTEDLIATDGSGNCHIDHELLESFGLFNLPKPVMRRALMVYYENAKRQSPMAARTVHTFINLASAINRFPDRVANNFTRGAAYRRNIKALSQYSR